MKIAGRPIRAKGSTPLAGGFNGAGDEDRRKGHEGADRRGRQGGASTEPAMKIAGRKGRGAPGRGLPHRASTEPAMKIAGRPGRSFPVMVRLDPASTEPAMKIAGRSKSRRPTARRFARFNGAGDEDRRKEVRLPGASGGCSGASTEPAMKIAGRSSTR